MTSEEKMHEEFEEWFKYNYSWFIEKGMDGYSLARFEDNHRQYVDTIPHHDWRVWKASRESFVIELTTSEQFEPMGISVRIGYSRAIEDCRESIHAAGVKTK